LRGRTDQQLFGEEVGGGGKEGNEISKENKQGSKEGNHYRGSKYRVRFLPWAT